MRRVLHARWSAALAAAVALAAPARAEQGTVATGPGATNPVGEYSGVEPGEGAASGPVRRIGRHPRITWIGFQVREGGTALVFVQLDREVTTRQSVENGALVITLEGAVYADRNARRPLDTRFFDTAVAGISSAPARRKGRRRGVALAIRFKDPAAARELTPQITTGKDGYTYLLVEVGPSAGG